MGFQSHVGNIPRVFQIGFHLGCTTLKPSWSYPSSDALKGAGGRQRFRRQLSRWALLLCSLRKIPTKSMGTAWSEVYEVCCPLQCPVSSWVSHITSRITHACSGFLHEASPALLWPFFFLEKIVNSKLLLT